MMKFIIAILFMNFMLINNNLIMFYYNLCYFISLMMIFIYMFKSMVCSSISLFFGHEFYSLLLFILSVWIVGLMMMSMESMDYLKLLLFINLLMILVMFFSIMDFLLFYFLFEVSLIPTFFLIVYWGTNPERLGAAYYLMMYMLMISFPLLLYILNMYMFSMTYKFSLMKMIMIYYNFSGVWEFFMVFTSFFIKMPIYIMHIWLPKAHVEAPVYGSMILAGILLKMGSYGIIRLIEMFFKVVSMYSYMVISIGVVGSLLVSVSCLIQVDMKSLVAYSSVVHMNLMLCSLLTLVKLGSLSSYIMMISHGLCSSGLFYMVNLYYSRSSSRLLMLNKGMLVSMPSMAIWWFLLCSANFSFPFSLGFISEMMMLMSLLNWEMILMIYLFMICLFSSAYSLYLFSYIQHGELVSGMKYSVSLVKEFMVLVIHFFPLVLFLFNLIMFM